MTARTIDQLSDQDLHMYVGLYQVNAKSLRELVELEMLLETMIERQQCKGVCSC